jgi:hypothetical protein
VVSELVVASRDQLGHDSDVGSLRANPRFQKQLAQRDDSAHVATQQTS